MAGLIASALAGGIAGAGGAAGVALGRMQETEEKSKFEKMRSELELQRQTAVENLRFANQEKGADNQQARGRSDFEWQRTGAGGKAAREAALADLTQKYDFDNDPTRVDRSIEIAGRRKRAEAENEGVTLGVGQQRIVGGKVVADNGSAKYLDALTARAARAGGGGGGAGGKKLSPEAQAEINDINEEEKGVQRAIDAATTEAAKTGGDASGGAFVSLQRRLEAVRLQKMRAFARHGVIDPVKDAEDVIAGGDIDEISRGMVQAQRLGAAYGKRFYDTVLESGVLQREQPGRAVPAPKEEPKRGAPRRETNPDDPRYKGMTPDERRQLDESYFGKPIVERLRGIVSGSRGTGFYGDQFKD